MSDLAKRIKEFQNNLAVEVVREVTSNGNGLGQVIKGEVPKNYYPTYPTLPTIPALTSLNFSIPYYKTGSARKVFLSIVSPANKSFAEEAQRLDRLKWQEKNPAFKKILAKSAAATRAAHNKWRKSWEPYLLEIRDREKLYQGASTKAKPRLEEEKKSVPLQPPVLVPPKPPKNETVKKVATSPAIKAEIKRLANAGVAPASIVARIKNNPNFKAQVVKHANEVTDGAVNPDVAKHIASETVGKPGTDLLVPLAIGASLLLL